MSLHASSPNQILTAFFDSRSEADNAISRIVDEGVPRDSITIVEGADASGEKHRRGFFEMLGDLFIPHEDRETYAEGLRRGGYFVSVPFSAANHDRVRDILDDEGTVDMTARADGWREEGWAATEVSAGSLGANVTGIAAQGARVDRSSLFERAPSTGPSGTGRERAANERPSLLGETEDRLGRRGESAAGTRTRSYIFDDIAGQDQLQRHEEVALGYRDPPRLDANGLPDPNQVELDDSRETEKERLRSGDRER